MKNTILTNRFWFAAIVILIAAATRLIPHPPNFAPIAAIALFGGAVFNDKRIAYAVPLIALLLSDAIIGFHSGMWVVYGSFAVIVLFGMLIRNRTTVPTVIGATLISSIFFFLATNLGSWAFGISLTGEPYAKSWEGLIACYTAALPFFRNSLLGDFVYAAVLFGSFGFAGYKFPSLVAATSENN